MTTTPTPRMGIAIDLDALDALVREFIAEHEHVDDNDDDGLFQRILLSTFILWVRRRQEQQAATQLPTTNLLTFRIEKERDSEL
jgi:hypothetical protein